MKGSLTVAQREYVLFHLNHHIVVTQEIRSRFFFDERNEEPDLHDWIIFKSSIADLDFDKIIYVNDLPVLFPVSVKEFLFYFDDRGNLIFCHDILKTIFYLLSGCQELNAQSTDKLNRFSMEASIQYKLGVVHKPIVNYFFECISSAIESFCKRNNYSFQRRRLFTSFGFLLTHDIDRVDLYTREFVLYKLKEIFGLVKSKLPVHTNIKLMLEGFFKYVGIVKNDNPYWNFDFLRKLERENNFRSVFYFLDKGVLHSDAYYSFYEERFLALFEFLKSEECEIGLHGPVESKSSFQKMQSSLSSLAQASNTAIAGIRQHRLLWEHPKTAMIQEAAGLKYDTTLGFAAHEGFRNSYCLPFKLFDFEGDRMMDIWEFPLNIMDDTLFGYRNYSMEEAWEKSMAVMNEVIKFGGVFTLLWHNSYFDELIHPGVTAFYAKLLKKISDSNPENLLGIELLDRMNKFSAPANG